MARVSASVGHSAESDPGVAGRSAATEALADVADERIVYVFSSSEYDTGAVVAGVDDAVEEATVVGTTTAGEIAETDSHTESVAVLALGGDGIEAASVGVGEYGADERAAGRAAVTGALDGLGGPPLPSWVLQREAEVWRSYPRVAGTVFGTDPSDKATVLDGVLETADSTPLTGGWAADDWKFDEDERVLHGRSASSDAVAVAMLSVGVKTGVGVHHGFEPLGQELTITAVDGPAVSEFDGRPAFEVYEELFGPEVLAGQALITRPVGVDVGDDERRILTPYASDREAGTISFTGASLLDEGRTVEVMDPTAGSVIEGAEGAIDEALADAGDPDDVAAVMLHDCQCRWFFLSDGETRERELDAIRERIGPDVPIVGWYTAGEVAIPKPLRGSFDQTMVAWVITNEPL